MKPGPAARRRRNDRNAGTMPVMIAGAGGILLLAAGLFWLMAAQIKPAALPGQADRQIGGRFTLTADDGRIVTDRSFPGKYLAIYFGYTSCPDICPETLNSLTGALQRLGGRAARVQPLFITVDPQRDQPSILHRYVAAFSPALLGLTGTDAQLEAATRAFHVEAISHKDRAHPAEYTVDHSSVIYLMAPDGEFVAPIPADADERAMAQLIARYTA